MQPSNHIAFKEWAVICAALGDGLQSLILRKGGIAEVAGGFQAEHREFWLFPTYLHERADALVEEARPLWSRVASEKPQTDVVRIRLYAVVQDVIEVTEPDVVAHLVGLHAWSTRTVFDRFNYKRPGLWVLAVRVYRLAAPITLPNSEYFAGCRSWVELPCELSTAGAAPVLDDASSASQFDAIRRATRPVRLA